MAPGTEEIEARVESLAQELTTLRRRVETLESLQGAPAGTVARRPVTPPEPVEGSPSLAEWEPAEIVGLAGRSLVILGGAFLLRAISVAALMPDPSGPVLGLLYAAWWLWKADRTTESGQQTSAVFYGLSAIAIAYPLLWETAGRLDRLPDFITAPALVAFLVAGLVVARRRSLRVFASCVTIACMMTGLALLLTTHHFILYTATLIAAAVVVEAFELREHWPELRWIPPGPLNLTLILLAVLVSQPHLSPEMAAALPASGVIAVSLLVPLVYLASVTMVTLAYRRPIAIFETLQVTASLLFGIGTTLTVIAFDGGDSMGIAISIVLIGLACYAVAFWSIDVAEHPRRNFIAYSSFAGILVAAGTWMALDVAVLGAVWFGLALLGICLGVLYGRNTLRLHGALYLAAAGFASGLAVIGFHGLLGPLAQLRPVLDPTAVAVALGSVAGYVVLAARRTRIEPHWSEHVPRFIVAAVAVWSIAGLSAPWLTSLLPAMDGLDPNATIASMRTCVLSLLAIALIWAGRRWSLQDFVWLVYPLLAATGVRLLWEDLRYGEPLNLFLALGFYGGALIVTSRLLRQKS